MTTDDIREEIAIRVGLPADALRGTTREELEAHAQQILKLGATPRTDITAEEIVDRALGRADDVTDIIKAATGR
jgi:hypothetical protein